MTSRLTRVLAIAAGSVFALGACGGGKSGSASSSTPTTAASSGAPGSQNAAFSACLKEHGVTLPSGGRRPPGNGQGTPGSRPAGGFPSGATPGSFPGLTDKQQSAFAACQSKLPNGGRGGFGGANAQALQAYLSCLGDHGVTVPTTTSGSTAGGPNSALGAVRNDPNFATANKTCASLLPSVGSTTTTNPN